MAIRHEILVEGNSLAFRGGFFGFSTIALIQVEGERPLLFDTGHHSTRLLLLDGLKAHGLAPRDIGHVFLSHLHFDHANNVDLFPHATIHLSAEEWQYAQDPPADDIFCSDATNGYLRTRQFELLDAADGELLPGLHYRSAPGHTAGSYLLHYRQADGQRVVFAGDACKTYRELVSRTAASEFDAEKRAAQTLAWIAENADIVIPGHFPPMRRTADGWTWDETPSLEILLR